MIESQKLPRPGLRRPGFLRELLNTLVFIVAVYAFAELAIPRSNIDGPSMLPNFHTGEYVIISRLDYLFGDPQRGDVAVFQSPDGDADDPRLIKRVIGIPGDTIEIRAIEEEIDGRPDVVDAEVYLNGVKLEEPYFVNRPCTNSCHSQTVTLGEDEYFFMGDNRNDSNDSRKFGVVKRNAIVGKAVLRYLPLSAFGLINTYRE
jgi:signal peptidase I